jgi:hypothetical protein
MPDFIGEAYENRLFLLMAQYDGLAVIPLEWVQRDYFRHLKVEKLLRKIQAGEIALPLVRDGRVAEVCQGRTSPTWQTTSTSKPKPRATMARAISSRRRCP